MSYHHLKDVLRMYVNKFVLIKTSSRHLDKDKFICLDHTSLWLAKTSSGRFLDIFKTSSKSLQDVLKRITENELVLIKPPQDIFKTFSRHFQDIFKTYYSRNIADVLQVPCLCQDECLLSKAQLMFNRLSRLASSICPIFYFFVGLLGRYMFFFLV